MAADSTKFPEQLKETQVWQAKRILWNTYNFGGNNTTAPDQLKLDIGAYNPLLGLSYGEIYANSRSMHKSQGFGSARQRGESVEYFKFLKGAPAENDIFQNVDASWKRFAETAKLDDMISKCIQTYNPQQPQLSLPDLSLIYKYIQNIDDKNPNIRYWKNIKAAACQELILQCAGLWMEAYTAEYSAVPGNEISISAQIIARNSANVQLQSIDFIGQTTKNTALQLTQNKLETVERKEILPATTPYSTPYWLTEPHSVGMYTVNNAAMIGVPENRNAPKVVYHISVNGNDLSIERPLVFKSTDPVKGEVYRPFEILPPVTVNISDHVLVFNAVTPKEISFVVKANMPKVVGKLKVTVPSGWKVNIQNPDINLEKKGTNSL
jgi:hypothetical protein